MEMLEINPLIVTKAGDSKCLTQAFLDGNDLPSSLDIAAPVR
jgi:succinyl-CoA synthetase beta subunit